MCVIGKKGRKSTNKLCKNYKLDKTELVMGTLVIDGTRGENDWYDIFLHKIKIVNYD